MKKRKKTLPFDKKNEEDFIKMTEKIQFALITIRNDLKIPVTQARLAKLAGCSRKTLYNRKGIVDELKQIKLDRKAAKPKTTNNVVNFNKKDADKTQEILIKNGSREV